MAGIEEVRCSFCKQKGDSEIFGEIYTVGHLVVHQHCLYFSSGLAQSEAESEKAAIQADVICGFKLKDITLELRRGLSIKCCGCHKPGGYVGCAKTTCRKAGHFPCLHQLGFTFHYEGKFEAYCPKHSPTQRRLCKASKKDVECCICLGPFSHQQEVYCPCCLTLFHKTCIQSQASSAGRYYFRCPVCNDKETFCTEMSRIGISIPDRDAKWEVGTNYFEELRCNAEVCSCPQGRSYHAQIGKYHMRKCSTCGQCRGHVDCLRGSSNECADCTAPPYLYTQHADMEYSGVARARLVSLSAKIPILSLKKLGPKDILFINKSSASS